MSAHTIVYEYPFNERIRTYLRLEHLLLRLIRLMEREDALDHHHALLVIFELMEVGARSDLKSDIMKDIDRQRAVLNGYRGNPAISEQLLDRLVAQLDAQFEALHAQSGKPLQPLHEDDWLMTVRSRISIPGGTCSFDLPAYHAWQNASAGDRLQDLQRWTQAFAVFADPVFLLLRLLREGGHTQRMLAVAGSLQQNLPQSRSYQLMRLELDASLQRVPEISANRLIVSVRMMKRNAEHHMQPCNEDCSFDLTLCA